jgi:hypothetical protein
MFEIVGLDNPDIRVWYQRIGILDRPHLWNRPPKNLSWHGIRDEEVDQGQTRVIADLDAREYMDPAAFGLSPTTAAMMRESWSIGTALALRLFHPIERGGGDVLSGHPFLGKWRNHRLIASSEFDGDFPTTEEIKATFTDISAEAVMAVATCKNDQ